MPTDESNTLSFFAIMPGTRSFRLISYTTEVMRLLYYFFTFFCFGWLIGLLFNFFSFGRFIETLHVQPRTLNWFQFAGTSVVVVAWMVSSLSVTVWMLVLFLIAQFVFILFLPGHDWTDRFGGLYRAAAYCWRGVVVYFRCDGTFFFSALGQLKKHYPISLVQERQWLNEGYYWSDSQQVRFTPIHNWFDTALIFGSGMLVLSVPWQKLNPEMRLHQI